MGWTNLATLQAQLDPGYQSKLHFLQEKLTGEAHIAQFQARQTTNLEQQRHYNNSELEQLRYSNSSGIEQQRHDHNSHLVQQQHANNRDLEQQRYDNSRDLEAVRAGNQADADARRFTHDIDMQRAGHYLKLQELQADLNKSLTLASLEYQASMLKTIDDAHVSVVNTISTMLLQQDAVMGEVTKMYAAARFSESKSRADHIRQLEIMRTQQELNMGEQVYAMLMETVTKFIEAGKEADARHTIDKLYAEALAGAF
ncbi:hypothetical protein UNDKW_4025 [Undibacterium sp. KW1]|uniref:hypothetical protein n=1 Tax=Undibacterium sp. KW1 TaxID=2058624 RepID=UPI001331F5D6|nr:hypothetical protein [Undibacterium sp. KW1]BBB62280.1 hypothetical protein UNDKW_4007 [Undibacterium sp. KW1]BBB62298.1 hypothetical protein UNDKW_4025 [Undibacterium sp. KW1]